MPDTIACLVPRAYKRGALFDVRDALFRNHPISCHHPTTGEHPAVDTRLGHSADAAPSPTIDVRGFLRAVTRFRTPNNRRAAVELAITAIPLAALWTAASSLADAGIWLGLVLTLPAGALLLRLFLIQHDCGHGSFFVRRKANTWAGRVLGVLTLTPYAFWRRTHAHHHARTGNLGHRGLGDIDTLTLAEYLALSPQSRWRYRLYRSPLVLFGLGPAYQFLIRHRMPAGLIGDGWRGWASVMATNLGVALLWAGLVYLVGFQTFLLVQIPTTLVAATLGVWLFYIQHQFEGTSWRQDEEWSFQEAALHGSSYYDLPPLLRWFSADIGVHHVHHLCSTIPFYRMQAVLRAFPQLKRVGRLGLRESFGTIRLTLWDEQRRQMISFADAAFSLRPSFPA